jgi:hypothetical protein
MDEGYDEIDQLIDGDPIELGRRYRAAVNVIERIVAVTSNPRNDFFRVGFTVCGMEDDLRATLP